MPIAIITGASRGFGRALAMSLAGDGWSLVIDARRAEELETVHAELRSLGAEVKSIPGDVSNADHRAALIAAAKAFGSLDMLVNNASTLGPSPLLVLENYSIDELKGVFEVNALAPLALIQLVLPMLKQSHGTVVSLSSDAAVEAYEGWGGYGSSKAALDHLHRVLAEEIGDVRFYSFDPGDMRTEMHQAAFPGEDISDRPEPEAVVPALRTLLDSHATSGRYRALELGS
ncbi:MAG TPA: SDR family oxidoreductase [Acidimicrobiales bacterium]|nr:SDR family oxidoreductase [Acidimicrobiales bacterium]